MNFAILALIFTWNISIVVCRHSSLSLEPVRDWRQLDFSFPTPRDRDAALKKGLFVPANVFPIDVDVDYHGSLDNSRIFVTTPRFSEGVPVTLGFVGSAKTSLLIQPYPDYSWHSSHGANCDGLTSVVRVAIDSCRQLWVLDTGVIGETRKCPPQLVVFNLRNDKVVRRYKFPKSQYTDLSLFITPVLDTKDAAPVGRCSDTKVYIADVTGFALIVYDYVTNKSWKIQNKLFYPYPNFGTFTIAGESFDLMDGLFGLAISPRKSSDDNSNAVAGSLNRRSSSSASERSLYFHALASGHENSVPLRILNDASIWQNDANAQPRAFKQIGRRDIQTPAQAMDRNGNLYFVLVSPLALVCWDSSTPYAIENIKMIYQNDATLQFASGLKIIKNLNGLEELWVMTNRFQKIAGGTVNPNDVNFRIQVKAVNDLLRGSTKCNGGQASGNNVVFPVGPDLTIVFQRQ